MKKFVTGFIVGAIICSMLGVFAVSYVANPVNFKVLVNGEEFVSDPPALEVNGRTYLPLRAMGEALGVPVNWNQELFQAEVGTMPTQETKTIGGYKTYAESKDIIDFGDFCKVTPCKDKILSDDGVDYVYDWDTASKIMDYIDTMENNGYELVDMTDKSLFTSCYLESSDSEKPSFSVGFGQPDVSSLDMYVIVTIYK